MLSVNISAYKGGVPRNHVLVCISFLFMMMWHSHSNLPQDILKRYRFDLPVGIEHDYANWEKISTYVSFALTQNRSKVKKAVRDQHCLLIYLTHHIYIQIKASIKSNTNIFALAQSIVNSTPCRPTIQLCARVALMVSDTVLPVGHDSEISVSALFMLNVVDLKSIGILLMPAWSSSDLKQMAQLLK